ncbi:hypothetical protein Vadar_001526 [Vaccinium darrowii]|uniref:Uncharacterized protein n=1 Tax=Vaccinium darrowii TaxID=229202 RepID=A0ACB7Z8P6_9ERIC|nr:hypothetical protein Vadar_001526 [Vaccinium darrowii]
MARTSRSLQSKLVWLRYYFKDTTFVTDIIHPELRGKMIKIFYSSIQPYVIYCSPIDIVSVQSVYVLALPQKGLESFVTSNINVAFILVILMVGGMVLSLVAFVVFISRAARREMCLCDTLIRQMEAAQHAERKSLNKSLAFASASHDIRTSLAGITGLIDMCCDQVAPSSNLETNLKQMEENTKDLLGILNSILDVSKIEAGKMQLEEEEFDLAQLLENVVNFYHPVGMKKGPLHCVPCLFFKKDEAENGQISMKQFKKIPIVWNSYSRWMIPGKEYRMRSKILVFENYVQVRETSTDHTQEGTGLGLGNVQSLVRLTSSEIGIVDKEIGEKGTCFRTSSLLHAKLTRPISMPEKTI